MAYSAKILADSIAPNGCRLVTFEITFPRIVLAEFNTHRMFSRNAASSRAIPVEKLIERIKTDPAMPVYWGKNQKGMQADEELSESERFAAKSVWRAARITAIGHAETMLQMGVHNQIVNRLLEPWMWATIIVSATDFGNFFNLRCHPAAQPEIRKIAEMMAAEYHSHQPVELGFGEWHLPLINESDSDLEIDDLIKISVGRCARVSYLTHDGKRDPQADIQLHDRLTQSGHWSPAEHQATPKMMADYFGNFRGWEQYRKHFVNENRTEYSGNSSIS